MSALPEHKADPKDKASQEHARSPKKQPGGMCEHRVAAGAHCKRCEDEKAAAWKGTVGG